MSELYTSQWDAWNNKSLASSIDTNPWMPRIPSPLSSAWTPAPASTTTYEPIFIEQPHQTTKAQSFQPPSLPACGVCRRVNCQLRSHRAYLSTRHSRSQSSILDLGYGHPNNAKPKVVDDLAIRTAFTKSYAFVEPSSLSVLQPSSFRIDVFHDLPVSNGDRPEMHKLIWNFLNNHLEIVLGDQAQQTVQRDALQGACLAAVMSDTNVCLCLLSTEKMIQELLPEPNQPGQTAMSMKRFQKCLDFIRQQPIDFSSTKTMSESVISLCLRLIFEIQGAGKLQTKQQQQQQQQELMISDSSFHPPLSDPGLITFSESVM